MGNSICRVDEGLFICGVPALGDYDRLRKLGIKCILNAAQPDLYEAHQRLDGASVTLKDIYEHFEVFVVGAEDSPDCNLSEHFERIAAFIEEGRRKGGVVVHCAAGISRASTSVMCYLMLKEHWTLEAAFRKVFAVRNIIHPNGGFWRQLRDLEASLLARGVELKPLPDGWKPREEDEDNQRDNVHSFGRQDGDQTLQELDDEARNISSFITKYLTGRLTPAGGVSPAALAETVQDARLGGVTWENVGPSDGSVLVRMGVIPTLDADALRHMLKQVAGVADVTVESVENAAPRQDERLT
eukprot:TRINITY_DN54119_c0_g1_i1.p1 TRINITY_DN54119_c0_g1~~TRINITY_DN54119_c0_g1_i1.p1  ORF type:complete len:299 (+),score=56.41 TRINITY_DN54119_c0_g1_i1:87-983(+)